MSKQAQKTWRILYGPSLRAANLSEQDTKAVNEIARSVGAKHELSDELKKQLWGAIQASKKSRHKLAVLHKYQGTSADLELLKTVKTRCSEMKRLLRRYTAEKALAHPNGKRANVEVYLATLDEIEAVAQRSMRRESTWGGYSETLDEWYVGGVLADIYKAIFGQPATPTMPAKGPGPFIRFVLAVHSALGLPAPPPATVRTWRLRLLKKRGARAPSG